MDIHQVCRSSCTPLAAAAAILCLAMSSSPAVAAQGDEMLFTGAAFGPTAEVAIQSAIGDAEESASAYQLYSCAVVEEPMIFPGPDPRRHRNFRAQVTVACTS